MSGVKYLATTLTNQNYMNEKCNTTFEECVIAFGQRFSSLLPKRQEVKYIGV